MSEHEGADMKIPLMPAAIGILIGFAANLVIPVETPGGRAFILLVAILVSTVLIGGVKWLTSTRKPKD